MAGGRWTGVRMLSGSPALSPSGSGVMVTAGFFGCALTESAANHPSAANSIAEMRGRRESNTGGPHWVRRGGIGEYGNLSVGVMLFASGRSIVEPTKTIVFVYGTLKRGERNHRLLADQEFLGAAVTVPRYRVFDLGPYPGLVRDDATGLAVRAELF